MCCPEGQDISARIFAFCASNSASVRMPWSFKLASSLSLLMSSSEVGAASTGAAGCRRRRLLGLCVLLGRTSVAGDG